MRFALPFCLLLAACSGEEAVTNTFNAQAAADRAAAVQRAADNRAVDAGFTPEQPAPVKVASVDAPATAAPGTSLPAADAQYRYLGRWAVTPALCADGSWLFQTRKLKAVGGTSCDLPDVSNTPAGYQLRGICRSGGRKTPETIRLTFDDVRKRMRVEAPTLGPADLLYCGP